MCMNVFLVYLGKSWFASPFYLPVYLKKQDIFFSHSQGNFKFPGYEISIKTAAFEYKIFLLP